MRAKGFGIFLGVEAVCCLLLYLMSAGLSGAFTTVMAFPFEPIGVGLRALSLSGGAGNVAAVALYAVLALLPIGVLVMLVVRRGVCPEDGLLSVLSPVLFAVLYLMINPSQLGVLGGAMGKAVLGCVVYSVLCAYLVLRVVRRFFAARGGALQRDLMVLLRVLAAVFVFVAFGVCVGELLGSIATLQAGNVGSERGLGLTYCFLALQYLVDALPYLFNVAVIFGVLSLLSARQTDPYSAEAVAAAQRLARRCAMALAATVLVGAAFNLLQLCFMGSLRVVNSTVQIPLLSIGFVLAVLLLTQLMGENKALKDDNDMYI